MSRLKSLSCFFVSLILLNSYSAIANDKDEKFDWMNQSFEDLGTLFSACLETPPPGNSVQQGSTSLNLETPDVWVATGRYVTKNRAIRFDWSTLGATAANFKKYRVLYRIDPRFDRPQVFIKAYNHRIRKYEATGFPKFNTTDPDKNYPEIAFNKMQDYVDYISFKDRNKIRVEKGDVINITVGTAGDFFGVSTEENLMVSELGDEGGAEPALSMLYTYSGIDNKIIYSNTYAFCREMAKFGSSYLCVNNPNFTYSKSCLTGSPAFGNELNMLNTISSCPNMVNGRDNLPLCFYDRGRGMKILVGGRAIKKESESFLSFDGKSSLYYKSDTGGELDFVTDWLTNDIFTSLSKPLISDWIGQFSSLRALEGEIRTTSKNNLVNKNLHFGRYIMIVEVGNGNEQLTTAQHQNIEVEYTIVSDKSGSLAPPPWRAGAPLSKDVSFDAYDDGYIWLKVKNPNPEVKGSINVNYATYTGTTWFSDIIYTGAVKPITDRFYKITSDFYTKLARNSSVQRIGRLALVLYICIYGLTFLAGATQITAKDLVIRIFKITLIVILLGDTSWEFFNKYLFNAYIKGTDYLMTNIVGITGTKSNIFGFIDPIFDKYTNGRFWLLLFIELLQIHNGLAFVAIITIYSLLLYFRAILEVIVSYVIAYVGLSVMISLAPFFLILMLFEKTKSIFENWLSTLFSFVMQPTILLIFFLLIDQLMYEQITKIVVRACWGILIPIRIGLDLTHLDIPINFAFSLPFLPGIPFFIPQVTAVNSIDNINAPGTYLIVFTSALLFYLFSKMAHGLVDYVTTVSPMLTNVIPARQEGNFQQAKNPTSGIVDDITNVGKKLASPVTGAAEVFKDKVRDQNYKARRGESNNEYTGKILASRHDRNNSTD